jgi:hypothetical protein
VLDEPVALGDEEDLANRLERPGVLELRAALEALGGLREHLDEHARVAHDVLAIVFHFDRCAEHGSKWKT